jgi:hypothetical protein
MQVRCKQFEYEGAKFLIGAFTVKQVEEILGSGKTFILIDAVCLSLNNARETQGLDKEPWTVERLQTQTDRFTYPKLSDEVFKFNEIKLREPGTGEAPAAESTSGKSAAESSQGPA